MPVPSTHSCSRSVTDEAGVQEIQAFSKFCQNNAQQNAATWDQKILLPGVTGNVTINLTVLDYADDGKLSFLGQTKVAMKDSTLWSKAENFDLALGPMEVQPKDGGGKEITIAAGTPAGTLKLNVEPFSPQFSLCGPIRKTGGDLYSSVWKERWVCLIDHELYYYDCCGETRPKAVRAMTSLDAVHCFALMAWLCRSLT